MNATQTCEAESVCGFKYESAFPTRRKNVRCKKTVNPKKGSRTKKFIVERPVETILLTLVGLSLLLGAVLIAVIVKLFMASRR